MLDGGQAPTYEESRTVSRSCFPSGESEADTYAQETYGKEYCADVDVPGGDGGPPPPRRYLRAAWHRVLYRWFRFQLTPRPGPAYPGCGRHCRYSITSGALAGATTPARLLC